MRVPVHGACLDSAEDTAIMKVVSRRWYTAGDACREFAGKLSHYTGIQHVILCNSGSSANLLAMTALMQPELGDRAIRPGDEVITTALNFPTTVNPIIQVGAVPVLIDVELPGMTPNLAQLHVSVTEKTKAVILAHPLGYPYNTQQVRDFCDSYKLWMIEDCCDALGSPNIMRGDLSTLSFYPAHQITTGEGGAVLTRDAMLAKILVSLRDWGKDCWCLPGQDNACGKRFDGHYDHKYEFSRIGYNLKMSDLHAAIGVAQMNKLPRFVILRGANHMYLNMELVALADRFILPTNDVCSWFGYNLICRRDERNRVTQFLEDAGIQTRIVFAGNILRQAAYAGANIRADLPLNDTNIVHERSFWVGCWPGLKREQLDYIVEKLKEYCEKQ